MKTIVLTGMMGAGKSTVANFLGEKLNIKTIDIDTIIEEQENAKISDIFQNKGEQYFRTLEKEIIEKTFIPNNLIISLGGGALENTQSKNFLLKNATVIYLKASPKVIFERIKDDKSRPLLCDNMSVEKIEEILLKREQNYQSASMIVETDNKSIEQITEEIIGALQW